MPEGQSILEVNSGTTISTEVTTSSAGRKRRKTTKAQTSVGRSSVQAPEGKRASIVPRNISSPEADWEQTDEYKSRKIKLKFLTMARTGHIPKPAQVRFALGLDNGKDITCVVATGFGKSLAYQMAVMLLQEKKKLTSSCKQFGICITPIEALGDDQVEKCGNIGIKAINLTKWEINQNTPVLSDVMNGIYDLGIYFAKVSEMGIYLTFAASLVYLDPEKLMQANSLLHKLLKVAEKVNEASRIAFIIMDECHLVEDW